MLWRIRGINEYITSITSTIAAWSATNTTEKNFTVSLTPSILSWSATYVILNYVDTTKKEKIYCHRVVGNTFYFYDYNRQYPAKSHAIGDSIQVNHLAEFVDVISNMVEDFWYVRQKDFPSLNVLVYGGNVRYANIDADVADTSLTLADDDTNYIVYDYTSGLIEWRTDTTFFGIVLAEAVTSWGNITSIVDKRRMRLPLNIDETVFARWSDWELKLVWSPTISQATEGSVWTAKAATLAEHWTNPVLISFVQPKNLTGTPDWTPANDEGKVPILNSSGKIDNWFLDIPSVPDFQTNAPIRIVDAWWDDTYSWWLNPALEGYVEWQEVILKPSTANTWACTLNIDSLGAINIKTILGLDPITGEIPAWAHVKLRYSWGVFVLTDPPWRAETADITAGTDEKKYVTPKQGKDYYVQKTYANILDFTTADGSGTVVQAHWFWRAPNALIMNVSWFEWGPFTAFYWANWYWWRRIESESWADTISNSASYLFNYQDSWGDTFTLTVSFDATNITFTKTAVWSVSSVACQATYIVMA